MHGPLNVKNNNDLTILSIHDIVNTLNTRSLTYSIINKELAPNIASYLRQWRCRRTRMQFGPKSLLAMFLPSPFQGRTYFHVFTLQKTSCPRLNHLKEEVLVSCELCRFHGSVNDSSVLLWYDAATLQESEGPTPLQTLDIEGAMFLRNVGTARPRTESSRSH
jgi:hypothetical protein